MRKKEFICAEKRREENEIQILAAVVLVLGVLSAAEAFVTVLVRTQMEQLSSRSVSSRGAVLVRVGTHSLIESLAQFGTGRVTGSGSRGVGTRTRARARPWDTDNRIYGKNSTFSFSVLLIIFFFLIFEKNSFTKNTLR